MPGMSNAIATFTEVFLGVLKSLFEPPLWPNAAKAMAYSSSRVSAGRSASPNECSTFQEIQT